MTLVKPEMALPLRSIRDFLDTLQSNRVFFIPPKGNHGDRLLLLAAQAMLEQASLTMTANPQTADFILINGGGSMVDGWGGLKRLAGFSKRFPSVPLAVMPSSFRLAGSELADICRVRQAPMHLWAREQPSLDILRNEGLGPDVKLSLDHDLAFSLDQHPTIAQLRKTTVEDRVLIVERDDWEGPTGRRRPFSLPGLGFIPEKYRSAVRKTLLGPIQKRQDRTSPFRAAALQLVSERHPEAREWEPVVSDISLSETCSFDEFLHQVARASVIVTTRMHVAILGHLLNRETYLVEGSYHKFRGVFEYSMQKGSTTLVRWNGQELEASIPV